MSTPHHLSDRYELGETLGFGGMSEVHFARDLRLHRDVAVKVLRADLARDPTFYLRFRREAQNAAKLNHPTIVQVFDTGEAETDDGPLPFIVMEYVDGDTLRDVLRANGSVSPRQAMTWMADVAAAMDFSHRNGIVHRDMKPANVMIDRSGAVKVMDFGIARAMSDSTSTMTQTSAVLGTAQYLSPEQARGIKVDPRSDIYSMGCVLFELLTGEPPFVGDSPIAVAHQHVHEDPRWPSSVREEIPRELDSVVLKAMSKNPANRYQSAAEMRSDLIKVLAGGKPSAPMLMTDEDRTEFMDLGPRRSLPDTGPRRAIGLHRRDGAPDDPDAGTDDSSRSWRLRALLIGAAVLVVALVSGLLLWAPWGSDVARQIPVPMVAGQPAAQARDSLEKAGFRVKQLDEPSLDVAEGSATRSAPAENVLATEGSEITLYISSGPQRLQIPDLRGKTPDEATEQLRVLGFSNVRTDRVDSSGALKDKVVNTTPPTGTEVPVNGAVVVHVGNGPREITIPDVTGQTETAARTVLEQVGLKVVTVSGDSELPAGTVVSSSPGAGATVEQGDTVQITVSRGNMFVMPNLRGQTPEQARGTLTGSGWQASTLTQSTRNVPITSSDDGKILSQTPAAGTRVQKDSAVSIVVGRASLLPG